jgi:UDP-N-acetylglucosamine--N-acetylmuramyl-(pentapeptide) pyrophosphoryl-undecaprenol N-acetylglucosamine transferase
MRLVVTGGGTGGHIYPAVAVALRARESLGADVTFIGSVAGPEGQAAGDAGLAFEGLELAGLVGKGPLAMIKAMRLFLRATLRCRRLFRDDPPDCVFGTGGYASAPACFAAASMKYPLILHEMNYEPGLVTRLLSRRASAVSVAFEGTTGLLRRGARGVVTGVPVRREIEALAGVGERAAASAGALREWDLEAGRKTLLVFGGSQGASALNVAAWEAIPAVSARRDIQVLHITGNRDFGDRRREALSEDLKGTGIIYRPVAYSARMHLAYAVADLALARAGAGTMAELSAAFLPAVLVPFPHAGGHQELNARELERMGVARVVLQQGESAARALEESLRLLDDGTALEAMRGRALARRRASGTEGVIALIEELT